MKKYLQDNSVDNLIHYIQGHQSKFKEFQRLQMNEDQVKEIDIVEDHEFEEEEEEELPCKTLTRK